MGKLTRGEVRSSRGAGGRTSALFSLREKIKAEEKGAKQGAKPGAGQLLFYVEKYIPLLDCMHNFMHSECAGGGMKRKDLLKKLAEAGFTFKEGGEHTKAYDKDGIYRAPIGRHSEISERMVWKIEKQTGVKLR